MSKAFDTVNLHTLIKKLLTTSIPPTFIKFISNYIKGRKAFTCFNHSSSKQKLIKTGVPQGGVLSPVLFNLYLSDIPPPPPGVILTSYADDITPISSHYLVNKAQEQLQPYLNKLHSWTTQNDLLLNPDKCSATLFTPHPGEYNAKLSLTINGTTIPTEPNPKILGLTFDRKLNYSKHIETATTKAKKSLNILKVLSSKDFGKQKETILTAYKAIVRPHLEYANTIWSPIISDTNLNKLQTVQNAALRLASGCTRDTNLQHLHCETQTLPIRDHLKLHASLLRDKSHDVHHPLFPCLISSPPKRVMKETIFHNNAFTLNLPTDPTNLNKQTISANSKIIHTTIVQGYLSTLQPNKLLNKSPPDIHPSESSLDRRSRCTLSQLRAGKSSLLQSYLNHINPATYPSPICPICNIRPHDTHHLFDCPQIPTTLTTLDLWQNPVGVADLLTTWRARLSRP
jgi:hypothetical protein